jgi:hypothetical protein
VEQAVPDMLRNKVNEAVLAYLRDQSAHSDGADALGAAVEPLGDVQTFCPNALQYRYVAVVTGAVIFGFATGMSSVGFRLPPELKTRALVSGADECAPAGPDWVSLTLFRDDCPEPDLRFWARKAYVYARRQEQV